MRLNCAIAHQAKYNKLRFINLFFTWQTEKVREALLNIADVVVCLKVVQNDGDELAGTR